MKINIVFHIYFFRNESFHFKIRIIYNMQIIGDNVFIIFVRHIFINDMLKPEMFPNFNLQPWSLIQFLSLHYTPDESTSKTPMTQITQRDITGFSCNWFPNNNLDNTLNGLPKKHHQPMGSFFSFIECDSELIKILAL